MGTRGAWGFVLDGKEKVMYNSNSSYPTWLGRDIFSFPGQVKNWSHGSPENVAPVMRIIARGITLVLSHGKPSKKQVRLCEPWAGFNVSERPPKDWNDLLESVQGDPKVYLEGLRYMSDAHEFLLDSFFCEWAYLYNLDSGMLEVYRGFNKDSHAPGRYSAGMKGEPYKGVALIREYGIADVSQMSKEQILELMQELENYYASNQRKIQANINTTD